MNFGGRLNDFLGGFKLNLIRSSAERLETSDGWLPRPKRPLRPFKAIGP